MLDKTKRDNRVKVLRGKLQRRLQKIANIGIDWEGMARKHATSLTHKEHQTHSWLSPSGEFYDLDEFGNSEHQQWIKTLLDKHGDKNLTKQYSRNEEESLGEGFEDDMDDIRFMEDSNFIRLNSDGYKELDIGTANEPTNAQNKAIQDLAISRGFKSDNIIVDGYYPGTEENYGGEKQLRRRMGLNKLGKLKVRAQKMAGLQKIAYAGIHSAKPVMDAFKNKKPLRFGEKPKGKKTEYAFQTDGKILYQSGYPIAEHTKNGIKFSYQGHPTATTSDTARYLGIDTFTKKGVTYINGQVIDPYGFDYVEVPLSNISDTPVKVNPKSKPIINEQTKQKNRDQEAFRLKAEKEALEGNQDLVVQTKTKKEVLDHGSITSKEQSNINKIIGVGKDKDETFATAYDHSLPAEEGGGIGGGVINRRMTGGAVPLSRKTHYEKHFPEKTIPKSFYKKISQLQGKLQKIAETDPYKRVIGKPGINRKEELQKDDGLPPKSYAMFDEDFAEGIPDTRVETFSGSPDSKIIEKKDVEDNPKRYTLDDIGKRGSEAINTDKGLFEKGESELSRKLEDLRINRISIKETGIRENLGDLIKRKYIPKYMREKSNEPKVSGISQGVITTDLAKRLAKLQKIALISENNTRPSMKSLAQEITNKFKANKLRGSVKGGFTYDPTSDTLLDASIKDQALQIRKIFGGQKGKNLGLNSITEDDMGNKPITDIGIISNQLHKLEKSGKKPILGGYKKGLNASFSIHGSDKDILKSLPHGQESSLSIEPNGNSYLLYPNGKKELITQ